MTALEFQGWAVAQFKLTSDARVRIQCTPVHTFEIAGSIYAGDIYARNFAWAVLDLAKGSHALRIHVKAKVHAQFSCTIERVSGDNELLAFPITNNAIPDVLDGKLPFDSPAIVAIPVLNTGRSWLHSVTARVQSVGFKKTFKGSIETVPLPSSFPVSIAPGQTLVVDLRFALTPPESEAWWRKRTDDDGACVAFTVDVSGSTADGASVTSNAIEIGLRCRRAGQSFVFTFVDHDGSVAHAAAIKPRRSCARGGCPVMLTLSGVGATARSQADAYKFGDGKKGYLFGFEEIWVLAPNRDGAHNWCSCCLCRTLLNCDFVATGKVRPTQRAAAGNRRVCCRFWVSLCANCSRATRRAH